MTKYRYLKKGEIIKDGDEADVCADGWRDDPRWIPTTRIGKPAPDPAYPSHTTFRRKLTLLQRFMSWLSPVPERLSE